MADDLTRATPVVGPAVSDAPVAPVEHVPVPENAPGADELPARPLPGNRDFGFELEWKHSANENSRGERLSHRHAASINALERALKREHGEGLGFVGHYHMGGSLPFHKVEGDPSVSGGEFITPILGTNEEFTYGHDYTPEEQLDPAHSREQGERVRQGRAHVKRNIPAETGLAHLKTAMKALLDAGAKVDIGTSFHTTLGIHDIRRELGDASATEAVRKILQGYDDHFSAFEKMLPMHRRGTGWGKKPTSQIRGSVDRARTLNDMANATGDNHRTAVNLGAVHKGRIEFRAMGGSLDPIHAQAWMEAMAALVLAAKRGDRMPASIGRPRDVLDWLSEHGDLPRDAANILTRHAEGTALRSTDRGDRRSEESDAARAQRHTAQAERRVARAQSRMEFRQNARYERIDDLRPGDQIQVRGYLRTITRVEEVGYRRRFFYRVANGSESSALFGQYYGRRARAIRVSQPLPGPF